VNLVLGTTLTNLAPTNILPRNDLILAFLQGIPGLNQAMGPNGLFTGEVMRLNLNVSVTAWGSQSSLGVAGTVLSGVGSDLAGFPNGRRPGDDVVDIALDVMMGALCAPQFVAAGFVLCTANTTAPLSNFALTDGAPVKDTNYGQAFPYVTTPTPGSYLDGGPGNVVQNVTVCYLPSQHGRCPVCSSGGGGGSSSISSPSSSPGSNNGGNNCPSGASRIGGLFVSLLNLF